MTEAREADMLAASGPADAERQRDLTTGLLPSQMLREAVAAGREILSD